MLNLTLEGVEIFIKRSQTKAQESFWNNYDLMIWEKNASGFSDIKGMYRNNSWGKAQKFPVDEKGIWKIPKKYVKHFK